MEERFEGKDAMENSRQDEIEVLEKTDIFSTSAKPKLSVLIPTYNRAETLKNNLQKLECQQVSMDDFEIVVVDDGSSDHTVTVLNEFLEKTKTRFVFAILNNNGGPARARNIGLSLCNGEVILNLGDDIEPGDQLLEKHMQFHKEKPDECFALLGFVSFPEKLQANQFMKWLETDGRKFFFNYEALKPGGEAGHLFFYTCNVSVKASLLYKSGWFDESFPYASHEDLELGYRLAEKGMHLVYDPTAIGYHWHALNISGISRRVYFMGHSADLFWEKVGDKGSKMRRGSRYLIATFCSLPQVVKFWQYLRNREYSETKSYPRQWYMLLFLGFFIGLSDSLRKRRVRI